MKAETPPEESVKDEAPAEVEKPEEPTEEKDDKASKADDEESEAPSSSKKAKSKKDKKKEAKAKKKEKEREKEREKEKEKEKKEKEREKKDKEKKASKSSKSDSKSHKSKSKSSHSSHEEAKPPEENIAVPPPPPPPPAAEEEAAVEESKAVEESAPPAEETPAEAPPTEDKPADAVAAEDTPTEAPLAEAAPAEEKPAEAPLAEETPVDTSPAEAASAEDKPAEAPPSQALPSEEPTTEAPPTNTPPAEATPVEAAISEDKPAEAPPAEAPPIEAPAQSTTAEDAPPTEASPPAEASPPEEQPLTEELKPSNAAPTEEEKPAEESAPAGEKELAEEPPAEEVKPVEAAVPVEKAAPAEEAKSGEETAPAEEEAPPAEEAKAAEEPAPAEETKPVEEVKAAESEKVAEGENLPDAVVASEEPEAEDPFPAPEKPLVEEKVLEEKEPSKDETSTPPVDEKPSETETTPQEAPTVELKVEPTPAEEKTSSEEKSAVEDEPAVVKESEPEEHAPEETPAEIKPAEGEPEPEAKPAETAPSVEEPVEETPAENQPEAETKPAENTETAPAVEEPADEAPGEKERQVAVVPAEVVTAEETPEAEAKPAETEPVVEQPAKEKPAEKEPEDEAKLEADDMPKPAEESEADEKPAVEAEAAVKSIEEPKPALDDKPVVEEESTLDTTPITEEAPAADEKAATEEKPVMEDSPVLEENLTKSLVEDSKDTPEPETNKDEVPAHEETASAKDDKDSEDAASAVTLTDSEVKIDEASTAATSLVEEKSEPEIEADGSSEPEDKSEPESKMVANDASAGSDAPKDAEPEAGAPEVDHPTEDAEVHEDKAQEGSVEDKPSPPEVVKTDKPVLADAGKEKHEDDSEAKSEGKDEASTIEPPTATEPEKVVEATEEEEAASQESVEPTPTEMSISLDAPDKPSEQPTLEDKTEDCPPPAEDAVTATETPKTPATPAEDSEDDSDISAKKESPAVEGTDGDEKDSLPTVQDGDTTNDEADDNKPDESLPEPAVKQVHFAKEDEEITAPLTRDESDVSGERSIAVVDDDELANKSAPASVLDELPPASDSKPEDEGLEEPKSEPAAPEKPADEIKDSDSDTEDEKPAEVTEPVSAPSKPEADSNDDSDADEDHKEAIAAVETSKDSPEEVQESENKTAPEKPSDLVSDSAEIPPQENAPEAKEEAASDPKPESDNISSEKETAPVPTEPNSDSDSDDELEAPKKEAEAPQTETEVVKEPNEKPLGGPNDDDSDSNSEDEAEAVKELPEPAKEDSVMLEETETAVAKTEPADNFDSDDDSDVETTVPPQTEEPAPALVETAEKPDALAEATPKEEVTEQKSDTPAEAEPSVEKPLSPLDESSEVESAVDDAGEKAIPEAAAVIDTPSEESKEPAAADVEVEDGKPAPSEAETQTNEPVESTAVDSAEPTEETKTAEAVVTGDPAPEKETESPSDSPEDQDDTHEKLEDTKADDKPAATESSESKPIEDAASDDKPAEEAPVAVEEAEKSDEKSSAPPEEEPIDVKSTEDQLGSDDAVKAVEEAPVVVVVVVVEEQAKDSQVEEPVEAPAPVEDTPAPEEAKSAEEPLATEEKVLEEVKVADKEPEADDKPAEIPATSEDVDDNTEPTPTPAVDTDTTPEETAKPVEEASVVEEQPAQETPAEEAAAVKEEPADEKQAEETQPVEEIAVVEEPSEEVKPSEEKPAEDAPAPPEGEVQPIEEVAMTEDKPVEEAPVSDDVPAERGLPPSDEAPTVEKEAEPAEEAPPPPEEEKAKPSEEIIVESVEEAKPAEEIPPAPEEEAKPAEEKAKSEDAEDAAKAEKAKEEEESKDTLGPIPGVKTVKKGEEHHSLHDPPLDFQQSTLEDSTPLLHEDLHFDGVLALETHDTQEQQHTQPCEDSKVLTPLSNDANQPKEVEVQEAHDSETLKLDEPQSPGKDSRDIAESLPKASQEPTLDRPTDSPPKSPVENTESPTVLFSTETPSRDLSKPAEISEETQEKILEQHSETAPDDHISSLLTEEAAAPSQEHTLQEALEVDDTCPPTSIQETAATAAAAAAQTRSGNEEKTLNENEFASSPSMARGEARDQCAPMNETPVELALDPPAEDEASQAQDESDPRSKDVDGSISSPVRKTDAEELPRQDQRPDDQTPVASIQPLESGILSDVTSQVHEPEEEHDSHGNALPELVNVNTIKLEPEAAGSTDDATVEESKESAAEISPKSNLEDSSSNQQLATPDQLNQSDMPSVEDRQKEQAVDEQIDKDHQVLHERKLSTHDVISDVPAQHMEVLFSQAPESLAPASQDDTKEVDELVGKTEMRDVETTIVQPHESATDDLPDTPVTTKPMEERQVSPHPEAALEEPSPPKSMLDIETIDNADLSREATLIEGDHTQPETSDAPPGPVSDTNEQVVFEIAPIVGLQPSGVDDEEDASSGIGRSESVEPQTEQPLVSEITLLSRDESDSEHDTEVMDSDALSSLPGADLLIGPPDVPDVDSIEKQPESTILNDPDPIGTATKETTSTKVRKPESPNTTPDLHAAGTKPMEDEPEFEDLVAVNQSPHSGSAPSSPNRSRHLSHDLTDGEELTLQKPETTAEPHNIAVVSDTDCHEMSSPLLQETIDGDSSTETRLHGQTVPEETEHEETRDIGFENKPTGNDSSDITIPPSQTSEEHLPVIKPLVGLSEESSDVAAAQILSMQEGNEQNEADEDDTYSTQVTPNNTQEFAQSLLGSDETIPMDDHSGKKVEIQDKPRDFEDTSTTRRTFIADSSEADLLQKISEITEPTLSKSREGSSDASGDEDGDQASLPIESSKSDPKVTPMEDLSQPDIDESQKATDLELPEPELEPSELALNDANSSLEENTIVKLEKEKENVGGTTPVDDVSQLAPMAEKSSTGSSNLSSPQLDPVSSTSEKPIEAGTALDEHIPDYDSKQSTFISEEIIEETPTPDHAAVNKKSHVPLPPVSLEEIYSLQERSVPAVEDAATVLLPQDQPVIPEDISKELDSSSPVTFSSLGAFDKTTPPAHDQRLEVHAHSENTRDLDDAAQGETLEPDSVEPEISPLAANEGKDEPNELIFGSHVPQSEGDDDLLAQADPVMPEEPVLVAQNVGSQSLDDDSDFVLLDYSDVESFAEQEDDASSKAIDTPLISAKEREGPAVDQVGHEGLVLLTTSTDGQEPEDSTSQDAQQPEKDSEPESDASIPQETLNKSLIGSLEDVTAQNGNPFNAESEMSRMPEPPNNVEAFDEGSVVPALTIDDETEEPVFSILAPEVVRSQYDNEVVIESEVGGSGQGQKHQVAERSQSPVSDIFKSRKPDAPSTEITEGLGFAPDTQLVTEEQPTRGISSQPTLGLLEASDKNLPSDATRGFDTLSLEVSEPIFPSTQDDDDQKSLISDAEPRDTGFKVAQDEPLEHGELQTSTAKSEVDESRDTEELDELKAWDVHSDLDQVDLEISNPELSGDEITSLVVNRSVSDQQVAMEPRVMEPAQTKADTDDASAVQERVAHDNMDFDDDEGGKPDQRKSVDVERKDIDHEADSTVASFKPIDIEDTNSVDEPEKPELENIDSSKAKSNLVLDISSPLEPAVERTVEPDDKPEAEPDVDSEIELTLIEPALEKVALLPTFDSDGESDVEPTPIPHAVEPLASGVAPTSAIESDDESDIELKREHAVAEPAASYTILTPAVEPDSDSDDESETKLKLLPAVLEPAVETAADSDDEFETEHKLLPAIVNPAVDSDDESDIERKLLPAVTGPAAPFDALTPAVESDVESDNEYTPLPAVVKPAVDSDDEFGTQPKLLPAVVDSALDSDSESETELMLLPAIVEAAVDSDDESENELKLLPAVVEPSIDYDQESDTELAILPALVEPAVDSDDESETQPKLLPAFVEPTVDSDDESDIEPEVVPSAVEPSAAGDTDVSAVIPVVEPEMDSESESEYELSSRSVAKPDPEPAIKTVGEPAAKPEFDSDTESEIGSILPEPINAQVGGKGMGDPVVESIVEPVVEPAITGAVVKTDFDSDDESDTESDMAPMPAKLAAKSADLPAVDLEFESDVESDGEFETKAAAFEPHTTRISNPPSVKPEDDSESDSALEIMPVAVRDHQVISDIDSDIESVIEPLSQNPEPESASESEAEPIVNPVLGTEVDSDSESENDTAFIEPTITQADTQFVVEPLVSNASRDAIETDSDSETEFNVEPLIRDNDQPVEARLPQINPDPELASEQGIDSDTESETSTMVRSTLSRSKAPSESGPILHQPTAKSDIGSDTDTESEPELGEPQTRLLVQPSMEVGPDAVSAPKSENESDTDSDDGFEVNQAHPEPAAEVPQKVQQSDVQTQGVISATTLEPSSAKFDHSDSDTDGSAFLANEDEPLSVARPRDTSVLSESKSSPGHCLEFNAVTPSPTNDLDATPEAKQTKDAVAIDEPTLAIQQTFSSPDTHVPEAVVSRHIETPALETGAEDPPNAETETSDLQEASTSKEDSEVCANDLTPQLDVNDTKSAESLVPEPEPKLEFDVASERDVKPDNLEQSLSSRVPTDPFDDIAATGSHEKEALIAGAVGVAAVSGVATVYAINQAKRAEQSPRTRSHISQPYPPPVSYRPHRHRRSSRSQERTMALPVKRPVEVEIRGREGVAASAKARLVDLRPLLQSRHTVQTQGESSRAPVRPEPRHAITTVDHQTRKLDLPQLAPVSPVDRVVSSPSPGIVVPDLDMVNLHRAHTLRRKRKMSIQRAEETVAAAVVIYAAAEALSPPASPPPGSPLPVDFSYANPHDAKDPFGLDHDTMDPDFHSPIATTSWRSFDDDHEELRKSVADLFTDDKSRESGSSRDRDKDRHRRRRHSHHSSRTQSGDERKERRSRGEDEKRAHRPRGEDEDRRRRPRPEDDGKHRSSKTEDDRRRRTARAEEEPKYRSSRGNDEPKSRGLRGEDDSREHRRRTSHHHRRHRPDTADSGTPGSGTPPITPKRRDSGFSAESSGSSGRRHRTADEQAAHDRRKEERATRRAARDRDYERSRDAPPKEPKEPKGKERATAPPPPPPPPAPAPLDRERSYRRRRHSHSTRTRPDELRERGLSDRDRDRDEARAEKKFFDVKHSAGVLGGSPPPREPPPPAEPVRDRVTMREPPRPDILRRASTKRSTFERIRQSLDEARPKYRQREEPPAPPPPPPPEPRPSRSSRPSRGSKPEDSTKVPSEDAARKARHQERRKARDDEKKPGGIKAAFKKLFGGS